MPEQEKPSEKAQSADFDVLITADEAWPAFERAVLRARFEVHGSFRVFDLNTRLRSAEAQAFGQDWFDLLAHVVSQGIKVTFVISDFDAVMATSLHELTWRTIRQAVAMAEVGNAAPGQVTFTADVHPARAGSLPWGVFLPAVLKRKWDELTRMNRDRLSRQAVHLNSALLPDLRTVTHHQKLAVIDDDVLFIGGLDLNERRFDTLEHDRPARETWSDVHLVLRGTPEVAEAKKHLETFLDVSAGKIEPPTLNRIKRTISAPRRVQFPYLSPRTVLNEIEATHLELFKSARRLIHIETQFLRSSVIAEALAQAATDNPDLTLLAILPALPEALAFDHEDGLDTRYGMALQKAAIDIVREGFGPRTTIASPVRPVMAAQDSRTTLAGSALIYVHNKVLVCDDTEAMIGSANLNGRSLRWDTEAAVLIDDPHRMARIRHKLLNHWWFDDLPPDGKQPQTLQPWWAKRIAENGVCLPENRSGFLVPHDPDNHAHLVQPLPGVTENIV